MGSYTDYDALSEEEYFKMMEDKVEFYKKQFPDMYEKAVQWMNMLNDSEIYKKNVPSDPNNRNDEQQKALDILKNALFQGWTQDDLPDKDKNILTEWIPDWNQQLEDNVK